MRTLALVALLLPQPGVLAPGKSLGGVRLGATPAQVERAWGRFHGTCRGCARPTWYFTYARFDRHGASVEFQGRRVVAVYTLWQPSGWRTSRGLALGATASQISATYGALPRLRCRTYLAYTQTRRQSVTAFYVVSDTLWGFGLMRPRVPACR
jgi:hypothetical protein